MKRTSLIFIFYLALACIPAHAAAMHIVGDARFGCVSKDYFSKLVGYAVDKDMEAFKKGLLAGVLTGECTLFKKGEDVFITDTSIFSGLVKIRREGETTEYWTNIEAVK